MQAIIDTIEAVPVDVRSGVALALAVACFAGIFRSIADWRAVKDGLLVEIRRLRHLVRALRFALMAACLAAIGIGWLMDAEAPVGLGIWIGLEELYETTMVLGLLRLAERMERKAMEEVPEFRDAPAALPEHVEFTAHRAAVL